MSNKSHRKRTAWWLLLMIILPLLIVTIMFQNNRKTSLGIELVIWESIGLTQGFRPGFSRPPPPNKRLRSLTYGMQVGARCRPQQSKSCTRGTSRPKLYDTADSDQLARTHIGPPSYLSCVARYERLIVLERAITNCEGHSYDDDRWSNFSSRSISTRSPLFML